MVKKIERSVTVTTTKTKPDHPHGGPPGTTPPPITEPPPVVEPPPVIEPPIDPSGFTWHQLPIGAGGFITGIDIAPDGTRVIRTDTYGAYVWSND